MRFESKGNWRKEMSQSWIWLSKRKSLSKAGSEPRGKAEGYKKGKTRYDLVTDHR